MAMWWLGRFIIYFSFLCLSACTATPSNQASEIQQSPKASIIVIDSPNWVFDWGTNISSEKGLSECLTRQLRQRDLPYEILPPETFSRVAFPDLPPELAPTTPQYVDLALTHPDVQSRLEGIGLKFLIYVAGTLEVGETWGDIECFQGGGCLGVVGRDKTSEISATVFDLNTKTSIITREEERSGATWFAIIGQIPLFYSAATRQTACKSLADSLIPALD